MKADRRHRHAVLRDRADRALFDEHRMEHEAWATERRLEARLHRLETEIQAVRVVVDHEIALEQGK